MLSGAVLCLGSNWREVEAALDRLVSQEREVATGDVLYMFQGLQGVCDSLEGWKLSTSTLTETYTRRSML